MNRKAREAVRERYEAQKQARSASRHAEENAQREARIQHALARPVVRPRIGSSSASLDVIEAKAPRLLDASLAVPLARLLGQHPLRSIDDWSPHGKARDTLFRSLASHLLARYPVPAIVWNAFLDESATNASHLVPLAAHVAGGGSLYDIASRSFPIPLTRAMCHALLATPSDYDLLDALRRVQARTVGADVRVFEAWRTTHHAVRIGTKEEEAFKYTVLAWLAKVPMLAPAEIGPLCDYVDHRRRGDIAFSMKGRSGPAVLRAMREWHADLGLTKAVNGVFRASGHAPAEYVESRREPNGNHVKEVWRIKEVLTAKALFDEGKRMGHCVYSYAWRIEKGDTSIWSVQMEDGQGETGNWHMVTLEVRNDLRRVVQARGRFNRAMTPRELRVVTRWAGLNDLRVILGSW